MTLLEPGNPEDCDAVTRQLCDYGRAALAQDDLELAESMFDAIEVRVATITKKANQT